jgi:hypothetical protein
MRAKRRVLESTEAQTADSEVVQSASLFPLVPNLPADRHSLLQTFDGLFKSASLAVSTAETGKHPCLGLPVLSVPGGNKTDLVDFPSVDQLPT